MNHFFRFFVIASASLFSANAVSDGHESTENPAVASIANQCFIKDGIDSDDIEDAMKSLSKWAKKYHPGILSVLTPVFRADSEGYGDIIIQSWMPFGSLGDFDQAIMENGEDVREDLNEVMDCGDSSLGGWFNYYMSESMQQIENGLISYQHCEINEGVPASKVVEYNNQEAENLKTNQFNGLLAFMDRGVGDRNLPGDYSKIYAFPDMDSFSKGANGFWNGGGWEFEEEVRMNAANCSSGNMYRFETLHIADQ